MAFQRLITQASKSDIIKYSIKAFWAYGPGVFTVALSYCMLTNLTQGQDVVMQVGEEISSGVFSLLAIVVWATCIWYSSRLIGYQKKFNNANWPLQVISGFPRMLAFNTFTSIQAAILSLPTIANLSFGKLILFIALQNFYFLLLQHAFSPERDKPRKPWAIPVLATTGLIYVAVLVIIPITKVKPLAAHQVALPVEAIVLFVLQLLSFYIFYKRRTRLNSNETHLEESDDHWQEPIHFFTSKLSKISFIEVPAWFRKQEQQSFNVFNTISIFALLWFYASVFSIKLADSMGPLAVIVLAFGIMVGVLNIFSYLSHKYNVNLFLGLALLVFIAGKLFPDPYEVQLTPANTTKTNRPSLDKFFNAWIEKRKPDIEAADSTGYPMYFVLADGGASRSGYWVGSVLSAWHDQSANQKLNLKKHLFCLSGASGGSVGNATFYSLMRHDSSSGPLLPNTKIFLGHDFLSNSMAHFLGPDLARHLFPFIPIQDRANAISQTMNYWGYDYLDNDMSKNVEEVFDYSGNIPALCINVTRVQGGIPSVVSSIHLKGFSKRLDILDTLYNRCDGARSISLSTAAVLGARFPYISPAGKIGEEYFVDGGYFDNSGSGIVHEMLFYLDSMIQKTIIQTDSLIADQSIEQKEIKAKAALYKKLRFHIVHITNTPDEKGITPIHPLVNDLLAPILTVFSTYNSQTEVNDERARQFIRSIGGTSTQINLFRKNKNESYPMNWVISQYRLDAMNNRLEEVKRVEITNLINNK